jgi:vitamin B12 transporter
VSNDLNEVRFQIRNSHSKEKSGKVIVKITAEDLKKRPGQSVASVLVQLQASKLMEIKAETEKI